MILRKPYAFLIKHFKLIHLLLAGLFVYSTLRTYQITTFINYYNEQGWVEGLNFTADTYVDIFVFINIIAIIIISTIVLLLMKKKEKPILVYIVNIVSYMLIFLLYIFSYAILHDMETKIVDTRIITMILDLNTTAVILQIVIIILALVRALGFDIKKFNFGEDLAELQIETADSEEVEVSMAVDTENAFTAMRHGEREFKYLYKENKFVINILAGLIVLIIGLAIYLNINVYNKVYTEDEAFRAGYFNVAVTDTFVTKTDYKDEIITPTNHSFLILKLTVTNITQEIQTLNIKNYRLLAGPLIYTPVLNNYNQLFDIGYGYNNDKLAGLTTKEYILVYLVDDRSLKNDLKLRYKNAISYYVGKFVANYKKVKLTQENLDKKEELVQTVKLKETLTFKDSLLKETTITINSYEIKDSFNYSYQYCFREDCSTNQELIKPNSNSNYPKAILALDTKLKLGDMIVLKGVKSNYDFVANLSSITYVLNGVTKTQTIPLFNQTPTNYKGSIIYFEVLKEIKDATNISLLFEIRNKQYIYKIK